MDNVSILPFWDDFHTRIDTLLQRIANILLLNASFIEDTGLLKGKMGIALFFYHYSRYTKKKIYEDYAGDLIDEISQAINISSPANFDHGLAGFSWGIVYLVNHKFIDIDPETFFLEIDDRIMKLNPNDIDDLVAFGFYFISRISLIKAKESDSSVLMKKKQLQILIDHCERTIISNGDFNASSQISSIFWFLLEMQKYNLFPSRIIKILKHFPDCFNTHNEKFRSISDQIVTRELSFYVLKSFKNREIRTLYNSFVQNNRTEINNLSDNTLVQSLISLSLKQLIFESSLQINTNDYSDLYSRSYNILINENFWNDRIDSLNESSLGLEGFAGLGFYILRIACSSSGLKI